MNPYAPPPETKAAKRLAVFDLDGTITPHDTFVPYLQGWLARHPRRRHPLRILRALGRFVLQDRDRGRLKSDLIRACMADAHRRDVRDWTAEFVARLELCPGALAAVAHHLKAGDRLVLLSASVDLYVPSIGKRLGFTEVICTGVVWRNDILDGALATPNRRGEEKKRCIADLRERFPGAFIAAYGNSPADFAHLAAVDRPTLVNGSTAARRQAEKMQMPTVEWRNKSH